MELITEEKKNILNLSEKFLPKELKKPKMYRLINLGKIDPTMINETTGQPAVKRNPFYITEGVETVYDKFEKDPAKRKKIIKNISGTELVTKDGKTWLEDKVEVIEFINGVKIVRPEEYFTYLFLERSNLNKSNPFRDTTKPAVWEEVEEEKALVEIIKDEDLRLDAEMIARTMTFDEARAYAKKLGVPGWDQKSSDEIRWNLRNIAKRDPRGFIKGSKDQKAKRKLQIDDAKAYGIIEFDPDTNVWIWPFEKDAEKRKICSVPLDSESPETILDTFFIEDKEAGHKAYKIMCDCLKNPDDFIS